MGTCIQCGKVCDNTENVWQPGEACLFGSLFACSVTCAVLWGLTPGNVRDGMRPGEPGWDVDVEPEHGQKDVVIGQQEQVIAQLRRELEAANARAEVFRLAIIEAEWSSAEGADSCPWCRWDFGHSHEADCPVTLARKT